MKTAIKMTYVLLLGLVANNALAQAKSINLILAESEAVQLGELGAVMVNDHLVFERDMDGTQSIWSYHPETQELTDLNLFDVISLDSFGEEAVMIKRTGGVDSAFLSDGTLAGTRFLINQPELQVQTTQHALYLIHAGFWSSDVFRYYNQTLTQHEFNGTVTIDSSHNNNVCELGLNVFLVPLVTRNFQGQAGPVTLGDSSGINFPGDESTLYIKNLLGQCFALVKKPFDHSSPLQFVVRSVGSSVVYFDSELVASLSSFTQLGDQLYAIETPEHETHFTIHHLDPDSLESISATEVPLADGLTTNPSSPPTMVSTGDALLVSYTDLRLYDADLNPIQLDQSNIKQPFFVSLETATINQPGVTLLANKYQHASLYNPAVEQQNPELAFVSGQRLIARFQSTQQLRLDQVQFNQTTQTITLKGYDFNTQKRGYYEISDRPKISHQINGVWYNDTLDSQGLSISKGVRQDRSEYVFLTAYLFRDGKPLWLAGTNNLSGQADSLTIDLYEFEGPQLFEPNPITIRKFFGTITLEMLGCHALQANLATADQSHELQLYRADNTFYRDWCQQ